MECFICGKQCPQGGMTCSEDCHELYVRRMEGEFGEYKKVVDAVSGIAYKVPTRHIIERGLKQTELHNFPLWNESDE